MTADGGARGAAAEHRGLPPRRRALAALSVATAVGMSALQASIVNLALPLMAEDLHVPPADIVWVVTAYQLALLAVLLPCAALGEILGYHRVFLAGLAGVGLAGLVCAHAEALPTLIAARAVQGLAAAAVMSTNGALLRHAYPPDALGKAIGINAMAVALAGTLGPGVGALLLSFASWHLLFELAVPLALISGALGFAALPRVPGARRRFDARAAGLNALTFGLVFLGMDRLPGSLALGLALLAAGLGAGWLLVRHERGEKSPLLPLDLLAHPSMGIALAGSVSAFAAQMLALVSLPFLMRSAWGLGPGESGALLLLWPLAVGAMAPLAGRLSDRVHNALPCTLGGGVMCVCLLLLSAVPGGAMPWLAAVGIIACGMGFGLFQTPNARAILTSAPLARSGSAGGLQATARQFGQALGTVAAAALFQLLPGSGTAGLQVAAGLALAAGLFSLLRLRRVLGR
jgi:DHA2 family multidrug resistance protein-like MFS transporter